MARGYGVTCNACGHEFEYVSGRLATCERKVCDTCGHDVDVPRYAPAGSPEFTELDQLREYMRSRAFDRAGRAFTPAEGKLLDQVTRHCTCGGAMVLDDGEGSVTERCPQCRSTDLADSGVRSFAD